MKHRPPPAEVRPAHSQRPLPNVAGHRSTALANSRSCMQAAVWPWGTAPATAQEEVVGGGSHSACSVAAQWLRGGQHVRSGLIGYSHLHRTHCCTPACLDLIPSSQANNHCTIACPACFQAHHFRVFAVANKQSIGQQPSISLQSEYDARPKRRNSNSNLKLNNGWAPAHDVHGHGSI